MTGSVRTTHSVENIKSKSLFLHYANGKGQTDRDSKTVGGILADLNQ